MTEPLNRRVDGSRIQKILDDMAVVTRTHARTRKMEDDLLRLAGEQIKIRVTLDEVSITMKQVHDLLITFKVTNAIAKYIASIGAACAALYYAWHNLK